MRRALFTSKRLFGYGTALAAAIALAACTPTGGQEPAEGGGQSEVEAAQQPPAQGTRPRRPVFDAPTLPFTATDFLKFPVDRYLGEPIAIARNSKGHLFVFHRSGNDQTTSHWGKSAELWEFDTNGRFVRQIGKGIYGFLDAHGVSVDKDDNIWAVDEGSSMVIKISPEGKVLLVLGRHDEPWDQPRYTSDPPREAKVGAPPGSVEDFGRPTDVAFDSAGNIYVADGYWNHRVVKLNKDGDFVKDWGGFGSEPGHLNNPHGIEVDSMDRVWVADRANNRLQVFDTDGQLLKHFPAPFPMFVCITPPPNEVIFTGDTESLYKFDMEGKALGKFGRYGKALGEFGWTHSAACPSENEVYVGEIRNWRVQKLTMAEGDEGATH